MSYTQKKTQINEGKTIILVRFVRRPVIKKVRQNAAGWKPCVGLGDDVIENNVKVNFKYCISAKVQRLPPNLLLFKI